MDKPHRSHRRQYLDHLSTVSMVICALLTASWSGSPAFGGGSKYVPKDGVCGNTTLDRQIYSTASGAWGVDRNGEPTLVVVDTTREDIVEIRTNGQLVLSKGNQKSSQLSSSMLKIDLSNTIPSRIRGRDGEIIFQDIEQGRLAKLNKNSSQPLDLSYHGELGSLPQAEVGGQSVSLGQVVRMFDWTPIEDSTGDGPPEVAFAGLVQLVDPDPTLTKPADRFSTAFITFNADMQGSVVKKFHYMGPLSFRSRYFEFPYFATAAGKAYALFLEGGEFVDGKVEGVAEPRLGEISFGSTEPRWLDGFPQALRRVAKAEIDLNKSRAGRGPELATLSLQNYESSESLAGIYGIEERLFVLFKEPLNLDRDETNWWLYEISPATGEVLSRTQVPSHAAHLTVVPGPTWAFVEKGQVEELGVDGRIAPFRKISSVAFAPMNNFRAFQTKFTARCVRSYPDSSVHARQASR